MKKGFKIVELPVQKCRKVAGIKQHGHRTANLKRHETPDKNLTVRFFYNMKSAFSTSQNKFQSFNHILIKLPTTKSDVSSGAETKPSFKVKLQKAARINVIGLTYLLVKSNIDYAAMDVISQISDQKMLAGKSAIKSKKQKKWLSI